MEEDVDGIRIPIKSILDSARDLRVELFGPSKANASVALLEKEKCSDDMSSKAPDLL